MEGPVVISWENMVVVVKSGNARAVHVRVIGK